MKITEALLGEHGVLYAQFDYLEKCLPSATDLGLVKSQGTMLAAALETHAHLEDELLFVAFEAHLDPKSGPLAVMRLEHEAIAQSLQLMQETQEIAEARNLLLHAIQTARAHFAKEEQIVFRMAQNMLEAETLALLGAQWAARRRVLI